MKQQATTLKNIAVIYGGRSVEHEISVITALQLMRALDITRYNIIPVYIAPSGKWYTGRCLFNREFYRRLPSSLNEASEVLLHPWPGRQGLNVMNDSAGAWVRRLLRKQEPFIPVDVYIPAFHGEFGEDGCIQGLLEMADAAYTSCDVIASAVAMNKYICKSVLRDHGIDVLPGVLVGKAEALYDFEEVIKKIVSTPEFGSFPLFVKPCHLGSSIGISKASDESSLRAGLAKVFRHDSQALIEPFLGDMFEINVSIMDGRVSVVEIPVTSGDMLSFEDKYLRDGGKKRSVRSEGMAGLTRVIDPEHLAFEIKERAQDAALKAYRILGCSGVVRFDFMHDNRTGITYFNELNPIPGSFSFYLWAKSKPPLLYTEELTQIIESAERRRAEKLSLEKSVGFRAL